MFPRGDRGEGVVNRFYTPRGIDWEGQVVHRARSAAADRIEGVLRALGYDSQGECRMVVLDEPVVPVPDDGALLEREIETQEREQSIVEALRPRNIPHRHVDVVDPR